MGSKKSTEQVRDFAYLIQLSSKLSKKSERKKALKIAVQFGYVEAALLLQDYYGELMATAWRITALKSYKVIDKSYQLPQVSNAFVIETRELADKQDQAALNDAVAKTEKELEQLLG